MTHLLLSRGIREVYPADGTATQAALIAAPVAGETVGAGFFPGTFIYIRDVYLALPVRKFDERHCHLSSVDRNLLV